MKLLLDQDVYAATARFLLGLGHDVVPVARIGLARAQDQEILLDRAWMVARRIAAEQGITEEYIAGEIAWVRRER